VNLCVGVWHLIKFCFAPTGQSSLVYFFYRLYVPTGQKITDELLLLRRSIRSVVFNIINGSFAL
jgi:hypothetical protein